MKEIDFQLRIELNTTGIDKFYVYIHSKDHFVPYESGRRLVKYLENWYEEFLIVFYNKYPPKIILKFHEGWEVCRLGQ